MEHNGHTICIVRVNSENFSVSIFSLNLPFRRKIPKIIITKYDFGISQSIFKLPKINPIISRVNFQVFHIERKNPRIHLIHGFHGFRLKWPFACWKSRHSAYNKVETPGLGLCGQILIRSQSLNIRYHPVISGVHPDVSHLRRIKVFWRMLQVRSQPGPGWIFRCLDIKHFVQRRNYFVRS